MNIEEKDLKLAVHDTIQTMLVHPDQCGITSDDMLFASIIACYSLENRLIGTNTPEENPIKVEEIVEESNTDEDKGEIVNEDA